MFSIFIALGESAMNTLEESLIGLVIVVALSVVGFAIKGVRGAIGGFVLGVLGYLFWREITSLLM